MNVYSSLHSPTPSTAFQQKPRPKSLLLPPAHAKDSKTRVALSFFKRAKPN